MEKRDAIDVPSSEDSGAPATEQRVRGKVPGGGSTSATGAGAELEQHAPAASGREHAEFVALLTQELRESLQAMLGFTQLMHRDDKDPLPERQRQRARRVLDAGDHVLHIIDEVLTLSRLQAGQTPMAIQAVDVLDALERVRGALEPAALSRSIQIAIGPAMALPLRPIVAADAGSFAQVLLRLGANAIEYNNAHGNITFHVSALGSSQLRTSVIDTGTGIAPDEQGRLFRPFRRIAHAASKLQGAGLGLVMCKALVELMGGSIGYRSVPGQGSEFWVDLPVYTA